MMGWEERGSEDLFCYDISLEKRVRADHPLRRIKGMIDFSFVYSEVADRYGVNGNVSVPPPVILKLLLLLVSYNVRSERELLLTLPERLDWLWFLGMKIDDPIPDHSVLSKARRRWGVKPFRGFFERIVLQCAEAGLVDGRKIFIDASLVEANASLSSVVDTASFKSKLRKDYDELVSRLEERELKDDSEEVLGTENGGSLSIVESKGDDGVNGPSIEAEAAADELRNNLGEGSEVMSDDPAADESEHRFPAEDKDSSVEESDSSAPRRKDKSGKVNSRYISTTDTEARIVRQGKGKPRLCHKIHRVVDERNEIITASRVMRGDANEADGLFALIGEHRLNCGRSAATVVADAKYGTKSNFLGCSERRIRAHIPDPWAERTSKPYFPERMFSYDARRDSYTCPGGKELKRWTYIRKEQSAVYRAAKGDCAACEHRPLCTRMNGVRTIKRLQRAEELEAMRLAARSEASKRDLKKRQHLMERSFATATRYGISRARWRGIRKMEIQELITSSIQNILKLISRSICPDGITALAKTLENHLVINLLTSKKTILDLS